LNREPASLAAVAAEAGDLAPRASALIARIEWPNKPGSTNPFVPLTALEEQRFAAGREVYRNACESCHQPDGRGQDRVAPSLVGSELALAPAHVTVRILVNGKEGPVGLMPPLGATLTDTDVAAVLTYVRREWGQTGTPVEPDAVAAVRKETSSRQRPWTTDELEKLMSAPATPSR
jgi:mono/diheme cytochrome c family protein